MKITIANYRNIPHNAPLTIEIKEGINFLLGINNVGKSNILKFFHELKPILSVLANNPGNISNQQINLSLQYDNVVNRMHIDKSIKIQFEHNGASRELDIKPVNARNTNSPTCYITVSGTGGGGDEQGVLSREIGKLANHLYIGTERYTKSNTHGLSGDILIGAQFITQWSTWQGGSNISHQKKVQELISEFATLFNFKKFYLQANHDKNGLQVTTDDGIFSLDELGNGFSHFILALGNALILEPDYILIDEPELSLHPKMQEVFVRALAAKSHGRLIASSHSTGLARSVAENILQLSRDANGIPRLSPFGQHYSATIEQSISEMSYSQFVELGGNNILLVEGRTDIKAYREILRLFGIEAKFIVFSFGGSEFIIADETKIKDELGDLRRLGPKSISVIIDSEKDASGATHKTRLAFEKICKSLGFNVFLTDHSATENYISQEALDATFRPGQHKALSPYEKLVTWDKNANWLLFRQMQKTNIEQTQLGKFIEDTLIPMT